MKTKNSNGLALIQEKKTGGAVLFDKSRYEAALFVVEEVNGLLCDLSALLAKYGYKIDEDFLRRVLRQGVVVFQTIAEEMFDRWAEAHEYPSFLAVSGKRAAVEAIPGELVAASGEILTGIREASKRMPQSFEDADLVFVPDRGALQVGRTFEKKLKAACSDRVSAEAVEDAKKLREMLVDLREIDARGYAVALLVQHFVGNRYKDPADLPNIDLETLIIAMQKMPYKVVTREEAAASGGSRLSDCIALTEASLNASVAGYYANMTTKDRRPAPPQAGDSPDPLPAGRFSGVADGLREMGFEV